VDARKVGFKFIIYDINHETLAKHQAAYKDGPKSLISNCSARGVQHAIISELPKAELKARLEQMDMMNVFERVRPWARKREATLKMIMVEFSAHEKAASICYIGDLREGLEVAKKFGMTTVGFADGPDAVASLASIAPANPDHTVNFFNEILPIFGLG